MKWMEEQDIDSTSGARSACVIVLDDLPPVPTEKGKRKTTTTTAMPKSSNTVSGKRKKADNSKGTEDVTLFFKPLTAASAMSENPAKMERPKRRTANPAPTYAEPTSPLKPDKPMRATTKKAKDNTATMAVKNNPSKRSSTEAAGDRVKNSTKSEVKTDPMIPPEKKVKIAAMFLTPKQRAAELKAEQSLAAKTGLREQIEKGKDLTRQLNQDWGISTGESTVSFLRHFFFVCLPRILSLPLLLKSPSTEVRHGHNYTEQAPFPFQKLNLNQLVAAEHIVPDWQRLATETPFPTSFNSHVDQMDRRVVPLVATIPAVYLSNSSGRSITKPVFSQRDLITLLMSSAERSRLSRPSHKPVATVVHIDSDPAIKVPPTSLPADLPKDQSRGKVAVDLFDGHYRKRACDRDSKSMLWTDKYQPPDSKHVIGNRDPVLSLRSWLARWKIRTDKGQRNKTIKPGKSTRTKVGGNFDSDDDEFVVSSAVTEISDSEDEDDGTLCNTILLTGPAGTGKSAAVQACAGELGFGVLELNAADGRSGRQIMSMLHEATQSHQVKGNKHQDSEAVGNPAAASSESPAERERGSKACGLPRSASSAVAKLFGNVSDKKKQDKKKGKSGNRDTSDGNKQTQDKSVGKKSKEMPTKETEKASGKRKKQKPPPVPKSLIYTTPTDDETPTNIAKVIGCDVKDLVAQNKSRYPGLSAKARLKLGTTLVYGNESEYDLGAAAKNLTGAVSLTEASLILIEDIDLVFDGDRGFWPAINQLMLITKKPIILTSTTSKPVVPVKSPFDTLTFRRPSCAVLLLHARLLCHTEGLEILNKDLALLITAFRHDVRRLFLTLQFWSTGRLRNSSSTVAFPVPAFEQILGLYTTNISCASVVDQFIKLLNPASDADRASIEDIFCASNLVMRARELSIDLPLACSAQVLLSKRVSSENMGGTGSMSSERTLAASVAEMELVADWCEVRSSFEYLDPEKEIAEDDAQWTRSDARWAMSASWATNGHGLLSEIASYAEVISMRASHRFDPEGSRVSEIAEEIQCAAQAKLAHTAVVEGRDDAIMNNSENLASGKDDIVRCDDGSGARNLTRGDNASLIEAETDNGACTVEEAAIPSSVTYFTPPPPVGPPPTEILEKYRIAAAEAVFTSKPSFGENSIIVDGEDEGDIVDVDEPDPIVSAEIDEGCQVEGECSDADGDGDGDGDADDSTPVMPLDGSSFAPDASAYFVTQSLEEVTAKNAATLTRTVRRGVTAESKLSNTALVVDYLPVLRTSSLTARFVSYSSVFLCMAFIYYFSLGTVCRLEDVRKAAGNSRRFSHYLSQRAFNEKQIILLSDGIGTEHHSTQTVARFPSFA